MFTTRPDTLFGATFMVLAPEHPLVATLTAPDRREEVEAYVAATTAKTEIDRLSTDREKTGVPIGADAINPVNGERIPIFVADYVLGGYGTGAIMAVPAHDERDFAFAKKFGLPIINVVMPRHADPDAELESAFVEHAVDEVMVNSGRFTGRPPSEAWHEIVGWLAENGKGSTAVTYRLRDWLVSRQRYWGTPIPIIHCEQCGAVPVPEDQLPVLLPDTVDYRGSGENPLNRDEAFLNVACPSCDGPARRESDTLDTFVDSSWYWFRYLSPHKDDGPIDDDMTERWTPVQQYTGGAEHAVMHLLYSRFLTKAMRDVGLVQEGEPFKRLFNQGQILGADGERMSKSRGQRPGSGRARRALRRRHRPPVPDVHGPVGPGRAVEPERHRRRPQVPQPRLGDRPRPERAGRRATSPAARCRPARPSTTRDRTCGPRRTARCTTSPRTSRASAGTRWSRSSWSSRNVLWRYRGTSVAGLPEWDEAVRLLLLMLAPAAPHISEELWSRLADARGEAWSSIHIAQWPMLDESVIVDATHEVPIQVNGKLRDKVTVPTGISEIELEQIVLSRDKVVAALAGKQPRRVIHAGGGRLVNIVI